jgi:DNA invertase Pin-like site-specific DNA recombinase
MRNELNAGKSIYDLPLCVTFYARVSTGKDEQTHSLKNQINYYSDFISRNPQWIYAEGYIDEALSGTNVAKRESFLKMIEDAKLGKFDFIITKEISRFSRNTLDSIKYTQELLSCGVGVLFQSDNINTLMPDSELRLTIMASIAQDEVRKISERVKFGFKRAIEKGVVLGNSKIWGYIKQDGKLVIDEKEAEMIRQIFFMYATQNMGIRAICAWLNNQGFTNGKGNKFSFSTIKNILTNPKYMGYYCGNKTHKYDYRLNDRKYLDESEWVIYKDEENVPPIVSEEIWNKANDILKTRSEKQSSENKTSYQNKYVYSGKIICGEHNVLYYRAVYRYKSGDKEVWQCREYSVKGKAGCVSPIIYTSEMDEVLKDAYNTIVKERTGIIHDLVRIYSTISKDSKIREDISKTKVEINEILKKKDKLLDLSIKGHLDDEEFAKRNRGFNLEIETLEARMANFGEEEKKNKDITLTIETLRKLIANELDFNEGFDNTIVDALLNRIEVYNTEEKNIINLKVYFKVLNEEMKYRITRGRNTSVCSIQYI